MITEKRPAMSAPKQAGDEGNTRESARAMHMYVWLGLASFLAVAQASSVAEAREKMLEEIGPGGDGSCPERDKAREHVRQHTPVIWRGVNAEFAMTDSANLIEADAECQTLRGRIKELEAREQEARKEATATATNV